MPDRILRQEILNSERVNRLSDSAEKFYKRLFSLADDYGRYEGRTSIIRAHGFALQLDRVKESDIKKWLTECVREELLLLYNVEGKEYIEILNFRQRLRIMKSKYPPPPSAAVCGHMTADVSSPLTDDSNPPPETKRRESESETESESKRKEVRAHSVPTVISGFVIPSQNDIRDYFKKLMGNTQKPGCWPEDKCHLEADTLLDHYTANGWIQNKGKPIKDWKAAVRNWIRNHLKGNFLPVNGNKMPENVNSVSKNGKNVQINGTSVHKSDPVAEEIEYLFGRFKENPGNVTLISTQIYQYDYLKKFNRISFSSEKAGEISAAAEKVMQEKKIPANPDVQKSYMKKLGILEFFKQLKETGAEAVFHAEN